MKRTPLALMSDKRRAVLAQQGNHYPTSTLASRMPVKSRKRSGYGPDAATVDAVLERDSYSCVVCAAALYGIRSIDYSIHHRQLRSQGGDNRLSNLVAVCGHGTAGCHGDIHASPAKAREAGWIVSCCDNPAAVLMAHALHGFVLLADDGRIQHSRKDAAA